MDPGGERQWPETALGMTPRGRACIGSWPPISSERVPVPPGIGPIHGATSRGDGGFAGVSAASFSGSARNISDSTYPRNGEQSLDPHRSVG